MVILEDGTGMFLECIPEYHDSVVGTINARERHVYAVDMKTGLPLEPSRG